MAALVHNETIEQTENDLEVPPERLGQMKLERAYRIGLRLRSQPRKILAVFSDIEDKMYIKSLRDKLEESDKFMHDQYPADVLAYRKKTSSYPEMSKR